MFVPETACTGLGLKAPLPEEVTMFTVTEGVVLGPGVVDAGVVTGVEADGAAGVEEYEPPPQLIAHKAVRHKMIARTIMSICSLPA